MADKNSSSKPQDKNPKPKDLPARPTDKKTDQNVKGGRLNTSKGDL